MAINFSLFSILFILSVSCNSQGNRNTAADNKMPDAAVAAEQIGQYLVELFEDSKGNLWMGTLEKGVARFDGKELVYFTKKDGLPSNRIVTMVEDGQGILWMGSDAGISRFDGKEFKNFSKKEGLCSDQVSNLFIDSKGKLWIGTWAGVCSYDGERFQSFPISYPKIDTEPNPDTKDWVTAIVEDSKGNIWFGRDGYGLCKYDGSVFTHFTKKEGLNSNNVQAIAEDREGNIWVETRVAEKDDPDATRRFGKGGLNKFDGQQFVQFPEIRGLADNDVYEVYCDASDDLWVSTINDGVYRYSNKVFLSYPVQNSTMRFLKDRNGKTWLGCAGGLFRIETDGKVVNVLTNGPWN